MPDRQFVAPFGTHAAPADWTLPASLEVSPRLAYAHFNGSGAASAYRPCLRLISDSGHVAAEAVADTSVAAGASADVSWFLGIGSSGSAVTQTLVGARIQATSNQSVPDTTNTDLVYQSVYFDTDGMANLGSNSRILTVNTAGIYLVIAQTLWVYASPGRRINTVIQNGYYSVGGIPDQFFSLDDRPANWAPLGGDGFGAPRTTDTSIGVFQAAAGDFFSSGCYQASGGNLNCNGHANAFLSAVLIGS